jgi:hypothetical protein
VWFMFLRAGKQANGDEITQESLRNIAVLFRPGMPLTANLSGAPAGVGSAQAVEVRGDELWAKIEVRPLLVRERNERVEVERLRALMRGAKEAAE